MGEVQETMSADTITKETMTTDLVLVALRQYPVTELVDILQTLANEASNDFYVVIATNKDTTLLSRSHIRMQTNLYNITVSDFVTGYLLVLAVEDKVFGSDNNINVQHSKAKKGNRYAEEHIVATMPDTGETLTLLTIRRQTPVYNLVLIPNRNIYNFTYVCRGLKTISENSASLIAYETDYCNLKKIETICSGSILLVGSNIAYVLKRESQKSFTHLLAATSKETYARLDDQTIIPEPVYLLSDLLSDKQESISDTYNEVDITENKSDLLTVLTDLSDIHGNSDPIEYILEETNETTTKESTQFNRMTLDMLTDLIATKIKTDRASVIYDTPNLLPKNIECLLVQNRILELYDNVYLVAIPK